MIKPVTATHILHQIFYMTEIKPALIDLLQVLLSVQLKAMRNRFYYDYPLFSKKKLKLMIHRTG